MIAYPGYNDLPDYDPVYLLLENKCDVKALYPNCNFYTVD